MKTGLVIMGMIIGALGYFLGLPYTNYTLAIGLVFLLIGIVWPAKKQRFV
jgi:uncharacterized membrane protein YdcZ (DUF606 family)